MSCKNAQPGKHTITNNTGHPILKGTVLNWTSGDKGKGAVTLAKDLDPNGTVEVLRVERTTNYTCEASFYPGTPDLAVKALDIQWKVEKGENVGTVTYVIENRNWFADAPASKTSVQTKACKDIHIVELHHKLDTPAIQGGSSVTAKTWVKFSSADYVQVIANTDGELPEQDKANNTRKSSEFGKCAPR